MNNMAYSEAAAHLDRKLDRDLATLRERQDTGEVTVRQASDLRISILSEHLAAITRLRVEHFGDTDPATGWNSGTCGTA